MKSAWIVLDQALFQDFGGGQSTPIVKRIVLDNDYITPEYIEAHAERLKQENRFSTGLLITVLRAGDPLPLSNADRCLIR